MHGCLRWQILTEPQRERIGIEFFRSTRFGAKIDLHEIVFYLQCGGATQRLPHVQRDGVAASAGCFGGKIAAGVVAKTGLQVDGTSEIEFATNFKCMPGIAQRGISAIVQGHELIRAHNRKLIVQFAIQSEVIKTLAILFIQLTPLIAQSQRCIKAQVLRHSRQKTMFGKAGDERRGLKIELIWIFVENWIRIGVAEIIGVLIFCFDDRLIARAQELATKLSRTRADDNNHEHQSYFVLWLRHSASTIILGLQTKQF